MMQTTIDVYINSIKFNEKYQSMSMFKILILEILTHLLNNLDNNINC